jgi:uncharacterized protein YkwD
MAINLIDILLVFIILLSVLNGWRRGFILGLIDLTSWIVSLLLGLRFYRTVAPWVGAHLKLPDAWAEPVSFLLVASVAGLVIHLLGYGLMRLLPPGVHTSLFNRALGVTIGLINGLLSAAIIAPLLLALPLPEGLLGSARESIIANRVAGISNRIERALTPIFEPALRQTINLRTIEPESNETIKLPFTVANPKPRPDLEAKMLVLVNQERAKAGLRPLAPDPALAEVGRRHAVDMFQRGYFAHMTPEGLSPFDRMKNAGVSYRIAGENLALAPTLYLAHTGLMNSPGHRANILRPQFGRVGISIVEGGFRGLMVAQEFRD